MTEGLVLTINYRIAAREVAFDVELLPLGAGSTLNDSNILVTLCHEVLDATLTVQVLLCGADESVALHGSFGRLAHLDIAKLVRISRLGVICINQSPLLLIVIVLSCIILTCLLRKSV